MGNKLSKVVGYCGADLEVRWKRRDVLLYEAGISEVGTVGESIPSPTYATVLPFVANASRNLMLDRLLGKPVPTQDGDTLALEPLDVVHTGTVVESLTMLPIESGDGFKIKSRYVKGKHDDRSVYFTVENTIIDTEGVVYAKVYSTTYNLGARLPGEENPPDIIGIPEGQVTPTRAPDHIVRRAVTAQQAFSFQMSGDYEPAYIDPRLGEAAGTGDNIFHRLATFGIAARAVSTVVAARKLALFGAQFASPVYIGDVLEIRMWFSSSGTPNTPEVVFQTLNAATGKVVLDRGFAKFKAMPESSHIASRSGPQDTAMEDAHENTPSQSDPLQIMDVDDEDELPQSALSRQPSPVQYANPNCVSAPELVEGPPIPARYNYGGAIQVHSPGDYLVIKRAHDEPPLHRLYEVEVDGADLNVMYCKLIAPAFRMNDVPAASSRRIPDAAGAFVRVYNRCPGDVASGLLMRQYRRYPRLLGDRVATPVLCDQIIAPVCRVVEQLDKTDLVVEPLGNGKIRPALVPMDRNDVWCTELIGPGEDIARPTVICANGCTEERVWQDTFTGEIRYCRSCGKLMHVECLGADGPAITDLSAYAGRLPEFEQEYLRYLLRARRPKSRMPYKPPEFGKVLEVDEDVHDKENKIPWPPKVTYAEVACLPIRRKTLPGDAPQTNEILIQHVLDLLERGEVRENDPVPHPAEGGWFHKVAPQAALRAVKDILCRDLSDARTDNMRWYICICCHKQLV